MRSFEFARLMENGKPVSDEPRFPYAKLPIYMSKHSAGADFFCAERVVIPSLWSAVASIFEVGSGGCVMNIGDYRPDDILADKMKGFAPTLVHTGVKASMLEDEELVLRNRSSNPKRGLVLANGVGTIDADYYNNPSNDGEIMFAFFNISPRTVVIELGQSIGQGVFSKFLRPEIGLNVMDNTRQGGFGSTGK